MYNKIFFSFLLIVISISVSSQETIRVDYLSTPKNYEIAEIKVTGAESYEESIIIGFSDLTVGQKITIPGDDITNVIKRFWKQGLFSDVKILADRIEGNKIWLNLVLNQRSKVSAVTYHGIRNSDAEEFDEILSIKKGSQVTPNLINETKTIVVGYFEDKGYKNVDVKIKEEADLSQPNSVFVRILVKKKKKVKVNKIYIDGNKSLSDRKINKVLKKTNESGNIWNIFSSKKFVQHLYVADKVALVEKYNEKGFRDAYIEFDTVKTVAKYKIKKKRKHSAEKRSFHQILTFQKKESDYDLDTTKIIYNKKRVDVYLKINEGRKYFFRDIKWVGNTIYPSRVLSQMLRISEGDVYNSKLLNDRLIMDEDAVSNLYQDNGYLFFNVDPVETNIEGDSIDYEMRIYEGKQAVIDKVGIQGNTRLYEHCVRRELRTKPGELYNKSNIVRTIRELAQMGHFDPEKIVPDIQPDPENGTVDVNYQLETKSSDQVELSAGYGYTGITGSLGLTFKNFAVENIFKPKTYKIVPQGEGQTFSIKGQTNGSYYTSFSASFMDPWFGNKRPNSLSVSVYHSRMSGVSSRYQSSYNQYDTYSAYSTSSYGASSYGYSSDAIDPEKYLHTTGITVGFGKRLQWPDDYFVFNAALTYQNYALKNWEYFIMTDGYANNLNLGLTLSRNSIDNPIYTRKGSSFSLSGQFTPPYSLITGKTYEDAPDSEKYNWLEFHKWKFKSKIYTPISTDKKLVLYTRAEYGFLGYYNKHRRSPFETFLVGGDGMSGYSTFATDIVGMRGYSSGSLTPRNESSSYNGNLYTRLTMELHYPLVLEASTTIYVLGFLEGGNCWSNFNEFNPFSLKRSAGIGVRLFLPMFGMMGVDWGYGFDLVGTDTSDNRQSSGSQFAFTIGQEF